MRFSSASLAALACVIAASILLTACAGMVRERIYFPEPMPAAASPWPDRAPEEVSVTTADGLILRGYYWAPRTPGGDLVVFFPGNAGNRDSEGRMAEPLARGGEGLLVVSYRGFGDNPGSPSEAGLIADAAAFLRLARERAPGSPIYLFGYSLGAAVALETAAREEVTGVVTLGAFSSLAAAAPPASRAFLPDRFDNVAAIRRVSEPVLLIHGTADEVVPFAHAGALQAAAPDRTRLLTLEGAPHRIRFDRLAPLVWRNLRQAPG